MVISTWLVVSVGGIFLGAVDAIQHLIIAAEEFVFPHVNNPLLSCLNRIWINILEHIFNFLVLEYFL